MNKLIAFFLCLLLLVILTFCTPAQHANPHKIVNLTNQAITVFYHPDSLVYPQDSFENRSFSIAAFTDEITDRDYGTVKYHVGRPQFIDSIRLADGRLAKKSARDNNNWETVQLGSSFWNEIGVEFLFKLREEDF